MDVDNNNEISNRIMQYHWSSKTCPGKLVMGIGPDNFFRGLEIPTEGQHEWRKKIEEKEREYFQKMGPFVTPSKQLLLRIVVEGTTQGVTLNFCDDERISEVRSFIYRRMQPFPNHCRLFGLGFEHTVCRSSFDFAYTTGTEAAKKVDAEAITRVVDIPVQNEGILPIRTLILQPQDCLTEEQLESRLQALTQKHRPMYLNANAFEPFFTY